MLAIFQMALFGLLHYLTSLRFHEYNEFALFLLKIESCVICWSFVRVTNTKWTSRFISFLNNCTLLSVCEFSACNVPHTTRPIKTNPWHKSAASAISFLQYVERSENTLNKTKKKRTHICRSVSLFLSHLLTCQAFSLSPSLAILQTNEKNIRSKLLCYAIYFTSKPGENRTVTLVEPVRFIATKIATNLERFGIGMLCTRFFPLFL